jgi:hypothetical protein
VVSKSGVKTLEPGHRLNPKRIGPISARSDSPILISSLLSEGPLGHRYRAAQDELSLVVSTYERSLLNDSTLARRLEQGLSMATSATHPKILGTHGFDLEGIVPFAVHADPRCTTVAQFIERRLAKARLPSVRTAMRLVDQLCEALEYLHPQSVHGLVSAASAFVNSKGALTLGGLGEGYAALRSPEFARLVTEGRIARPGREMGPKGKPEVATDVYLVAAFIVEVLTGRPYSDDRQLDSLLTTFSSSATRLIRSALHPDPDERPESVAEFHEELTEIYKQGPAADSASRIGRVSHASVLTTVSAVATPLPGQRPVAPRQPAPAGVPMPRLGNTPSDGLDVSLAGAERSGRQHDPYAGTSIGPAMRFDPTPPPGGLPAPPLHGTPAPGPLPGPALDPAMPPGPGPGVQHPGAQHPRAQHPGAQHPRAQHPGGSPRIQPQAPRQHAPLPHQAPHPQAPGRVVQGPQGHGHPGVPAYSPTGPLPPQAAPLNHANTAVPTQVDHAGSGLSLGLGSGSLGDLAIRLEDVDGGGTSDVISVQETDLSSPVELAPDLSEPELGYTGDGVGLGADELDASQLGTRLAGEDPNVRCYLAIRNEIEFGPYTLDELRHQARDGKLTSVDGLINRVMDQEFLAADHPDLRPIFVRVAKQNEALLAQEAFEAEKRSERRARQVGTLGWLALAVLLFGGAGVFLWLRANGG